MKILKYALVVTLLSGITVTALTIISIELGTNFETLGVIYLIVSNVRERMNKNGI